MYLRQQVIGTNLDGSVHLLVPAVVKLVEGHTPIAVRKQAMSTLSRLCVRLNVADYVSRIIHPLIRVLDSGEDALRDATMQTLTALVRQLGHDYVTLFGPMMKKVLQRNNIQDASYNALVMSLQHEVAYVSPRKTTIERTSSVAVGGSVTDRTESSQAGQNNALALEKGEAVGLVGDASLFLGDAAVGTEEQQLEPLALSKLKVNEKNLQRAWGSSQVSVKEDWRKEDWAEWLRKFSVELLRESPSPALRSCLQLAQVYTPLARQLFNAGFVSCWTELQDQYQGQLVRSLEAALMADNIPPEILQNLLNLAEFMEHHDKPLPIDYRTLGALAEKCHAYAKALHYKEMEFRQSQNIASTLEALISINNKLQQPQAAIGVLLYAQKEHKVELKESWYEKLGRWEDALAAYEKKGAQQGENTDVLVGRLTCLHALGEWEQLSNLAESDWPKLSSAPHAKSTVAPLAAAGAWHLARWGELEKYVSCLGKASSKGLFFRAVVAIHRGEFNLAQDYVQKCRSSLETTLTALMGESYNRAYSDVVSVQQLAEMAEVIFYKRLQVLQDTAGQDQGKLDQIAQLRQHVRQNWKHRLGGARRSVEVWDQILMVQSLVIPPHENVDAWLKMASLCRKSGKLSISRNILNNILLATRVVSILSRINLFVNNFSLLQREIGRKICATRGVRSS